METSKKKVVFGIISLLISAILQATFSCYLQDNRIVLAVTCIYAVLFLKYLKDESVVNWLTGRWSKKTLRVTGIIVLFIGLAFLPQSPEQHSAMSTQFWVYLVTYICWMMGLLLIDVSGTRNVS